MFNLEPREYFTIVRQLADYNDSTTYYVRATIRNARTDALIDTVALTDKGNRRFSLPWQVPADTSGMGFYISVLTEVFTDSGFSTKNGAIGDEMETYLVQERNKGKGGGYGGADIDYKRLKKLMESVVEEAIQSIEKPEPLSLYPVLLQMAGIRNVINNIKIPEYEPDMKPIIENNEKMMKAVKSIADILKEMSKEEDDFSPILTSLKDHSAVIMSLVTKSKEEILKKEEEGIKEVEKCVEKYHEVVGNIEESIADVHAQVTPEPIKEPYRIPTRHILTASKLRQK